MDIFEYFKNICDTNRLAKENGFFFCKVTSIAGLEEVTQNLTKENCFFAMDTVTDGSIIKKGGGFFERQVYVVYLLKRFDLQDTDDNMAAMQLCRELRRQICSRLVHDSELYDELTYLNTETILYRELDQALLSGLTGTFFTFNVDVPYNLCFNLEEWL